MFSQVSVSHSVHRGKRACLVPDPFQGVCISGPLSLPGVCICGSGSLLGVSMSRGCACVMVKRKPDLCAPRHQCTGSQGPPGLGYGPPIAALWLLWAGKAITRGFPPTAVARDMTSYASYQISGRWHMQHYITTYIIYQQYKSGCNPMPGSPFASLAARDLSTP